MVCGRGFHPEKLLPISLGTMANQVTINHRSTVHSHSMKAEQNGMMHFVNLAITLCARKRLVCEIFILYFMLIVLHRLVKQRIHSYFIYIHPFGTA